MEAVIFKNKGLIDLRAIKTFGVSAKETENPIGFFGTGLKYAIAIILREGCKIEMFRDGEKFVFQKEVFNMRSREFEGITMNGEHLPFTTDLGKTWQMWQAYREIYCNCLDEIGGEVREGDTSDEIESEGQTVFRISGAPFLAAHKERNLIVLSVSDSLKIGSGAVDIYNTPSSALYYRGIRVMDLPKEGMFTYNITADLDLTEDRTVKYSSLAFSKVAMGISRMKDKSLIRKAITCRDNHLESDLSYSNLVYFDDEASEEFMEIVAREYKLNNDKLNRSVRDFYSKKMQKSAAKHYEPDELTVVEQKQLDRAVSIIKKVWPDFTDYRIMVVKSLGQETMALADESERAMVLSKRTFHFGTKYLTATLIEEYMHLKTGYRDCTRELQTHLFDTICTLIENMNQEPI